MIGFTLPWALVGLIAAGLPLLLHLIQRHDAPERAFPAVRYLQDAARAQQRKLRFRHLLLLIVRTLLIIAIVLAAAGPTIRSGAVGPHAPSALVILIDNSAPSGVVVDGEPLLAALVRSANQVLDRATASDRVWLIAADAAVRSGSVDELRQQVGALATLPTHWNLGAAITLGRDLVRNSARPGGVVVVSGLPANALGAAGGRGSVLVLRPGGPAPVNRGVARLRVGVQPWNPMGGTVAVTITSGDTAAQPVALAANGRPLRDLLARPGVSATERVAALAPGWFTIVATLPPDELRLDDADAAAVRVAPPAAVEWDASDRYVNAAAEVLAADGRIRPGTAVHLGRLTAGNSIVFPPEDPAEVSALNRALVARGVGWTFGPRVVAAEQSDTGALLSSPVAVMRRQSLERSGNDGEVLATVGGAPWLVRSGDVLLFGSRPDPEWTALPLSAAFVPFLDAALTSAARGELIAEDAIAGVTHPVPPGATGLVQQGREMRLAGSSWIPMQPGVGFYLAGRDTIGAVSVHLDSRVSQLVRPTDAAVRAIWPDASVSTLKDGARDAFAFGGRSDLRGPFLILAILCALAEMLLSGSLRRSATAV